MSEVTSITKLEAVNDMLYDIGERPVSSLSGNSRLDVTRAEATLDRVTRDLCSRGWFFNRERHTFSPDGTGRYIVPANIVRVEVEDDPTSTTNYVVRTEGSSRILINTYDQVSTGYTEDLTLNASKLLEFEQLPALARAYIYARATVINIMRAIGATELVNFYESQATGYLAELKAADIEHQGYTMQDSPRNFDIMYNR